jgi:primosomal protein N' (replication factor Y)
LAEVVRAVRAGKFRSFLLHGVTGSGKTEIYLRAIAATLALGKQAIFLVPEIALTPQMVEYLRERFGSKVAVLHSRLSQSERSQEWRRLARGEAQVVVGARSAVFAPVPRLGLVVLDEEHESSYKQEVAPRYHTREVALRRAQMSSAVVLMGSATPTLETYYWARQGVHKLLVLEERVDGKEMPRIEVVDMREELRRGNSGIFSGHLERRMDEVLARGEQVLLFLNRRGYYPVLVCRECGRALKCRFCDITLTYHRNGPVLRCHYCGFSLSSVPRCPSCGQDAWVGLGTGTQRVEEEIRRRWPGVRILRLDRDVVRYRGAHEKIYRSFLRGEADVLIGTQMVAKGFNFPRLTLVGVVNADITLNLPDFRARERTFQLLTQVAGRAGRGEKPGEVVVQTYFPEDYSIRMASRHDYLGFYRQEIRQRRKLGYPPFSHLVLVMVSSVKEERARSAASELYGLLTEKEAPAVRVLGPAPAPRAKLEGKYRYQLILKGRPISALREKLKEVLSRWSPKRDVQIAIDFSPLLNV